MSTSDDEIPTTMKRLIAAEPGEDVTSCKIQIETVPVPKPASGEVLIKVAAAAVNPSDYGEWYRSNPGRYPFPIGNEGCGVVVATGDFLASLRFSVGSKVGFTGPKKGQGFYSEYATMPVTGCFPMPEDVPIEDCASFFVNPYTAIGILDTVKNKDKSPAFVHTAAASQLGQMIVKLAPSENIEVINVVRREDQAVILRELGAKHIVVTGSSSSSSSDKEGDLKWKDELKAKIKLLSATCAFDAVSGRMAGDLLDVLPSGGTLYTYGALGGLASNINAMHLIYRQKKMKGFYLPAWIREGGIFSMVPRMLAASGKVNSGLKAPGWSSSTFMDTTLDKAHEDIVKLLGSSITGKKLRLRFD